MRFSFEDQIVYGNDEDAETTYSDTDPVVITDLSKTDLSVIEIEEVNSIESTSTDVEEVFEVPERLAPSPIIFLGDSELETTVESPSTNKKGLYKCRKCKAVKKGHTCPANLVQGAAVPLADSSPPSSRAARNIENLTRLAQRVEGDNARDSNWSPYKRTSPRLKRTRQHIASSDDSEVTASPPKKRKSFYLCSLCHQPKKGHICTGKSRDNQTRQLIYETPTIVLRRV